MGSFGQTAFGGGEWDTASQGRIDHPWHRKALSVSVNGQAGANEAWHKRSGTKWLGPTYKRLSASVREFESDTAHRYAVALTSDGSTGWAHMYLNDAILTNASNTIATSSSAAGVLTVVTSTATGWSVGDSVIFDTSTLPEDGYGYLNRWLTITAIAGTTITLKNDESTPAAFGFDSGTNALTGATIRRIARFTTGILSNVAATQICNLGATVYGQPIKALLLHPAYAPQLISLTAADAPSVDTVTIATATFSDGPYLDPTAGGSVSGYSGSITYTPSDGTTFVAGDVSRHIRLYHEPAAWASGTIYVVGDRVTYNGGWWKCVYAAGAAGIQPGLLYTISSGQQVMVWAPLPQAGRWAWGTITAQATTSCTVSLTTNLDSANGATITSCRLGEFTTSTYPGTGALYLGRLYLGGCREGRFSASMSGSANLFTFSPTDVYGKTYDDYGFSESISASSQDQIAWIKVDRLGLLMGSYADEFLLTSAGESEVITPFNKTIRKVSSYGSLAYRGATSAGFTTIFMHNAGHQAYEYLTEAMGSAPSGRPLNDFNQGIVKKAGTLSDIAYTESRIPVIWAVAADGQLFGATYRRTARSMSQAPDMLAWSRHKIADGGLSVDSLCVVSPSASVDYLYLVTTPASSSYGVSKGVQRLMPFELREEGNTI